MTADFGADHLLLGVVDPAIGLGCRYQCTQDGMAVLLDFRPGQHVHRTHRRLRRLLLLRGLAALPGLISLECHHPQRGQRCIVCTTPGA
ncbi:hypothetical protein D3C79_881320 [compost metagenome]